jgi:transaldolase
MAKSPSFRTVEPRVSVTVCLESEQARVHASAASKVVAPGVTRILDVMLGGVVSRAFVATPAAAAAVALAFSL